LKVWCEIIGINSINEMFLELILLNNTEKISPNYVEGHIKNEVPFISNVVLVGEGRKYLTCLLTLKVN